MKIAILLTATVRPQVSGANFSIPQRMEMYRSTLAYYAKTLGGEYPVVVVENSDADLSSWQQEFEDTLRLEILQFPPAHLVGDKAKEDYGFDNRKSKGYNEYLMIELAMERSQTLRECTHFLKITGRYPMLNIRQMISEMERSGQDKKMMLDVKEFELYEKIRGTSYGSRWGDSRFFLMSTRFYRDRLMDCYKEMDDGIFGRYAEDYLYRLSVEYRKDKACSFRFRRQVQFGGQSGDACFDEHYASVRNRVKNKLRSLLRVLFPNVWF